MARNMYGATSADFTITSGGRVIPGAVLTLWTARTGGTQITDLLDVDSVACTTVTSASDGSVVYYGPNNDKTVHWADDGQGARIAIRPVDITGDPPVLSIGTVTTGTAAASLTGTSEAPILNLTLPSVGTNGVDTAAIQDSAVTTAKIATSAVTTGKIAADAVTADKVSVGITFTVGATPPASPKVGAEWADTSSPPETVIRKWNGSSWLVWLVTDASIPTAIGDPLWGGYYVGVIDTTRVGSIDGADPYQTGLRYMLIVSPKSIEYTTGLRWKTADTAGPAATATMWNGLAATEAMYQAGAAYEAATYCRNLSFPSDGGSRWYLPAKNELELLYRNMKPTTAAHFDASGANIASDPTGVAYTPGATTNPAQSSVTWFQSGGAQALEGVTTPIYWSSSELNTTRANGQQMAGANSGFQTNYAKSSTSVRVRPVRQFIL